MRYVVLTICAMTFATGICQSKEENSVNVRRVECSIPGLTVGKIFGIDRSLVEDIVQRKKINRRVEGSMVLDKKFGIFDKVTFLFSSGGRNSLKYRRQIKQSNPTNRIEFLQFSFRKALPRCSYEEFQKTFSSVVAFVGEQLGCELQCPVISDPSAFSTVENIDRNPYYRDWADLTCTATLAKNLKVIVSGEEPTFLMRGTKTIPYKPGIVNLTFYYDYSLNSETVVIKESKDKVDNDAVSIDLGCDMSKSFDSYVQGVISYNGSYGGSRRVLRSKFEKNTHESHGSKKLEELRKKREAVRKADKNCKNR